MASTLINGAQVLLLGLLVAIAVGLVVALYFLFTGKFRDSINDVLRSNDSGSLMKKSFEYRPLYLTHNRTSDMYNPSLEANLELFSEPMDKVNDSDYQRFKDEYLLVQEKIALVNKANRRC